MVNLVTLHIIRNLMAKGQSRIFSFIFLLNYLWNPTHEQVNTTLIFNFSVSDFAFGEGEERTRIKD